MLTLEPLFLTKTQHNMITLTGTQFNMNFHAGQPFTNGCGKCTFCRHGACSDSVWHTLADSITMSVCSLRSRLIYNSFDCRTNNINISIICITSTTVRYTQCMVIHTEAAHYQSINQLINQI